MELIIVNHFATKINKENTSMKTVQPKGSWETVRITALFLAAVMIVGVAAESVWAKTTQEINASVNACLDRFYKQVKGGKEMAAKAKGVLVMPGVVKAGLVVGGEYGEGALRVGGKTVSYYNLASGSVGFQIGGEAKDFVKDGALELGGRLPSNTHGGQLSEAYIHGMNGVNEGVRLIRGTSVNQPAKNDCVLVTAGVGVPTSAMILGKLS